MGAGVCVSVRAWKFVILLFINFSTTRQLIFNLAFWVHRTQRNNLYVRNFFLKLNQRMPHTFSYNRSMNTIQNKRISNIEKLFLVFKIVQCFAFFTQASHYYVRGYFHLHAINKVYLCKRIRFQNNKSFFSRSTSSIDWTRRLPFRFNCT